MSEQSITPQATTEPVEAQPEEQATTTPEAWAAVITSDHGTTVTVRNTQEKALAAVGDYVIYWWDDEMDGEPMPEDQAERIDQYFEKMGERGESWSVVEADLSL